MTAIIIAIASLALSAYQEWRYQRARKAYLRAEKALRKAYDLMQNETRSPRSHMRAN